MKNYLLAALISLISFGAAYAAENAATSPYTWEHAIIRQAPSNVGAAYVTLNNPTKTADKLINAKADWIQKIELHEIKTDANGVMQMSPLAFIALPAKGHVELRQGSFHLMLFGIKGKLKEGDKKDITLNFEKGGSIKIPFTVEPIGNVQKMLKDKLIMDHSHHQM